MNEIIKLNNISKEYMLGDEKITALNKVNLTVNRGDFLSITGASGSGKSTLMNILGFLDKADDGQYFFEGINQHGNRAYGQKKYEVYPLRGKLFYFGKNG